MNKVIAAAWVLLFFAGTRVMATHDAGGFITYEFVSTNSYIVTLHLYRNCSQGSASPGNNRDICYSSASMGFSNTITIWQDTSFQLPYNSCSATGSVMCGTPFLHAYEEYIYKGIITLPGPASDWKITHTTFGRGNYLSNLINTSNYGLYLETFLDNLSFPVNSSPDFNIVQPTLHCLGTYSPIDFSATDADSDSLVYTLVPSQDYLATCPAVPVNVTYAPPYSPTYPVASFTPVFLNAQTGLFGFTPALIQAGAISVLIEEYRNGQFLGSIRREDQIAVIAGIANLDAADGLAWYDVNANGVKDSSESPAAGLIAQEAGGLLSLTDTAGRYHMDFLPGNYSIMLAPVSYYNIVPAFHAVSFTAPGQLSDSNDFALQPIPGITDLSVSLSLPPVISPGSGTHLNLRIKNIGTDTSGGILTLTFDTLYNYLTGMPPPSTLLAGSAVWNISPFMPGQSDLVDIYFQLDPIALAGSFYYFTAQIQVANDTDLSNNQQSALQSVLTSYDPNAKYVLPDQPLTASFFSGGQHLEYTIAFQNTGLTAAQTVIVYDALDYLLDMSTFQFTGSSHPSVPMLSPSRLLSFTFNNINLLPAQVSDSLSRGFVRFTIKPESTMQPGQTIINGAGIVFDANAPVFTNLVYSPYPVNTAVTGYAAPDETGLVYPNPAAEAVTIDIPGNSSHRFELMDLSGRIVATGSVRGKTKLSIQNLAGGIYLYRIMNSDSRSLKSGKLVIVR